MPHPFGFCGRPGGIAWPRTRQYTESDLDASNVFALPVVRRRSWISSWLVFATNICLLEAIMFRSMSGFKAQYHYLTLLAISEFNEWRVLLYGPSTTIHGTRQFSEAKAKEQRWPLPGRTFTT